MKMKLKMPRSVPALVLARCKNVKMRDRRDRRSKDARRSWKQEEF